MTTLRCYGCEHCTHDDHRDDGICLGHCGVCLAELNGDARAMRSTCGDGQPTKADLEACWNLGATVAATLMV